MQTTNLRSGIRRVWDIYLEKSGVNDRWKISKHMSEAHSSPYVSLLPDSGAGQRWIKDMMTYEHIPIDEKIWEILVFCSSPKKAGELEERYSSSTLNWMVQNELLLDASKVWQRHKVRRVEIEATTSCNWRCRYCPVSKDPKPRKSMSMDLFKRVIEKAERHRSVEHVTLHSYSEISLDKDFEERVQLLAKTRLRLHLFSNGSGMNRQKLLMLKDAGIVDSLCFNLPTLDEELFTQMTGAHTYKQSIANIDLAIEMGLPVRFSIMHNRDEQSDKNISKIREKYEHLLASPIEPWNTSDRAGLLQNEYSQSIDIKEPYLAGCNIASYQLHIAVNGDCFICCEDYYQKEKFANIDDAEIEDILTSESAQRLRKRIFGGEKAPDDFICRKCTEMKDAMKLVRPQTLHSKEILK